MLWRSDAGLAGRSVVVTGAASGFATMSAPLGAPVELHDAIVYNYDGDGAYDCIGPIDTVLEAARGDDYVNQSPAELGARVVEALDIAYRSAASGQLERRAE